MYEWKDQGGRTIKTVAGPGVATASLAPDYPREMMAAGSACCVCWKDCQTGDMVWECDNGRPAHVSCVEWSVFAIRTEDGPQAETIRQTVYGPEASE